MKQWSHSLYFVIRDLTFSKTYQKGYFGLHKKGKYNIEGGEWDNISLQAKDLILNMMQPNPKLRLSAKQAYNSS